MKKLKIKSHSISDFVTFSIVLFLVIFVLGTAAFIFSMRQIIETNKNSELSRMLDVERINLENSVNGEIAIVLKMASSPLIQRYFANPNEPLLEKIALEEIAAYQKAFSGHIFWINSVDKMFHFGDQEPYLLDTTLPDNYWYAMTLYETETYNFNINYNPDLKLTNLWINAPVFDSERKSIGMVGTGVDVSKFINAVYEHYKSKTELYFFNDAGEITGAKNPDLVAKKIKVEDKFGAAGADIFAMAKKLKSSDVKTFATSKEHIAVGTLPVLKWYSVAISPDDLDDYKTPMTLLFGVVLATILLIFVIFNIFISRFINSLNKTLKRLEAASQAKSSFLAKMSHEIRTPMNAITGMAELALREKMPVAAQEHVMTIKQASANLLSIINNILDISKIESGKLEIISNDYLFSSMINDVVSIIRMKVMDSNLDFVVNIDCNIPNELYGDETRVRQILLNILSNAVKYTKKGFVSFSIIGEITDSETVVLTIDVIDSGMGIKQDDLKKLFNEFVQVDTMANKGIEGTGLGLAITKNLVTTMGGDVSVYSEYEKGSTFTVVLPQKIRSPEPIAKVENPEEKKVLIYEQNKIYSASIFYTVDNLEVSCVRVKSESDLCEKLKSGKYTFLFVSYTLLDKAQKVIDDLNSNILIVLLTEFGDAVADKGFSVLAMPAHSISVANVLNGVADSFSYNSNDNAITRFIAPNAKILIVDDISTNLKVAEGLMLPYQMQIDICQSGAEAIEEVKKKNYDLVFMDHMMPGMDGVETVRRIRELGKENNRYLDLSIVALTANAVSGTKEMFLSNGFNDFLSKPIDTVKLNIILSKWIPRDKQEGVVEENKDTDNKDDINFEINGVDIKKGISMTGGTMKFYMQTLSIFHKDAAEKIEEIKKCLETENYSLYTTHVHALKSASASIGAAELSELAKKLETAGKNKDTNFIKQQNPRFLKELEVLIKDIIALLSMQNDSKADSIDFGALKTELMELKTALGSLDSAAIDKASNNLREFVNAKDIGGKIEKILQNTLIGEYDEAEKMIEELLAD